MSVFRCLCFCTVVALSAVSMRAEVIKVTFDAKDYKDCQSVEDWKKFVEELCKILENNSNYDKPGCTFRLSVRNGDIFGTEPPILSECLGGTNDDYSRADKILRRVTSLDIEASKFSTASPRRLFPMVKNVYLPLHCLKEPKAITGSDGAYNLFLKKLFDVSKITD